MPPDVRKRQKSDKKTMKEIIHSGHFMVSDIDDPEIQDGEDTPSLVVHESDCEDESLPLPEKGFDFESACKETSKTYTFGYLSNHSICIDASLTKLFECMTLAYSGKLTSPRWKQFKGLKLRLKQKIRLNNMIWRAWHMQFVMKIKIDKICQFATPLDGDTHMKPEAVVIEGTYWKRRMANITAEYKKWRLFYRDRFRSTPNIETEAMDTDWDSRWSSWSKDSYSCLQSAIDEDFLMDFTDTLFSSFNPSQPFDFPNPKEIAAKAGIADFIQPGLVQLQPSVDDFMDTLEPLSDLFSDFLNSKLPPLPEETTYGGSLQDIMSPQEQQTMIAGLATKTFERDGLLYNRTHAPITNKRQSNFKRSIPFKPFHPSYANTSHFPNKSMMQNVNFSSQSGVLPENVPLLNNEPLPPQPNTIQPFMCRTVSNQPSQQRTSLESLLQGTLPSERRNMQSVSESLPIIQVQSSAQSVKQQEHANQFFQQQPAFISKSTDLTQASHLTQGPSMQVPLETITQGQITQNILPSGNVCNTTKGTKQPIYFSVSLPSQQPAFKMPVKATTTVYPQGKQVSTGIVTTQTDSTSPRRHSYTTGQHPQSSGDYMGTRRSRPIAPATGTSTSGSFAVPEVPQHRRIRSRSVSSPQSSSSKPYSQQQQPQQAVSLTDITSPLHQSILSDKRSALNSNVLQQNAILAQLLTPGCAQQEINQTVIKVTNTTAANVTSPVTIIRPLLSTTAHTLVFSPLSMTTSSGMNDLQRNIVVGTANSSIGSPSPPCAPDSPSSSTCSSSPAISTVSFDSGSCSKAIRRKSDEEKIQYKEHRRVCHINAEQKRRCNIKNGFESLHNLLPSSIGQTPNSKISKAALLQRGAEYICTLKTERQQQIEEAEMLKKQIEELNQQIGLYQSQLPASGAPIPCQRTNRIKEMFAEYVRQQTLQNWKFYILSLILEPLVESFNGNVSTVNMEEMCKSILMWQEQHCSLAALRPRVLNSLRHLSTTTSILSDPSRVPEEVVQAITKKETSRQ